MEQREVTSFHKIVHHSLVTVVSHALLVVLHQIIPASVVDNSSRMQAVVLKNGIVVCVSHRCVIKC